MEEDDFDFDDKKSRSVKVGRRAKKTPKPPPDVGGTVDDDAGAEEEMLTSTDSKPSMGAELDSGPPKPSRRMGGWGAESAPSRKGRRKTMEELEDERLRPKTPEDAGEESDNEPDIPTIPDLEDQQDEDMTSQVAMAPNVAVNRVATYRELDNDLLRHAAFLTLDNEIDLKLLSKGLSAEADVQEEDTPWDWDRLFTEVTSELLTEWERKESSEEETSAVPVA